MKKLFDVVTIRSKKAVIVKIHKKIKWTSYYLVFEDAQLTENDWDDQLIEYEIYREDELD